MARTHGHGNPDWSRDETILALNLYFEGGPEVPGPSDFRVIRLSEILRRLPIHVAAKKTETFRNPDSVAFKLQNLRNVATGKGLANVSKMDRLVWSEFGEHPTSVKQLADAILRCARELKLTGSEEQEEVVFAEGRLLTRLHNLRERNPSLRRRVLRARYARGALREPLNNPRK